MTKHRDVNKCRRQEKCKMAALIRQANKLCIPPPPPHHPPLHAPCDWQLISESQAVKAVQKRCVLRLDLKDVRDGENWVCIGTRHFHRPGAWSVLKRRGPWLALVKSQVNTWDREQFVRLKIVSRRDLWGVYEAGETVWEVRGQCTIKVVESQCH